MAVLRFGDKAPKIAGDAFISPLATIIGNVEVESEASVFPGAIIRGDVAKIRIGRSSNIQDNVVIHGGDVYEGGRLKGTIPVDVGSYVTVAHGAILHGCTVGSVSIIGVGAMLFDGSKVGGGSIIGMGAAVLKGVVIPERSVVVGIPGKVVKEVGDEEYSMIRDNALRYVDLARSLRGVIF